jgi:hypothetical protein
MCVNLLYLYVGGCLANIFLPPNWNFEHGVVLDPMKDAVNYFLIDLITVDACSGSSC